VSQKRLVVESPWSLPANASGLDTHHHGSITIRGGRSVTAQELEETYLPAFKACVMEGNAQQIMCSYNSIAVSGGGGHSYNSTPACLNGDIQNRQMRGEWGFKGSVVSVGAAAPTPFPSDLGCVLRLSECSRWHWCFQPCLRTATRYRTHTLRTNGGLVLATVATPAPQRRCVAGQVHIPTATPGARLRNSREVHLPLRHTIRW
jgi:hypothetical protein